jgi:hypothetical protein
MNKVSPRKGGFSEISLDGKRRKPQYLLRFSLIYWISSDVLESVGRGIRTPVTRQGKAVFKTACFNHSHIPPRVAIAFS